MALFGHRGTPPRVPFVAYVLYVLASYPGSFQPGYEATVRVYTSFACTADSAWLSKQLENRFSRPRSFEAADRGKHAYPDSGLQAYPRQWASNS